MPTHAMSAKSKNNDTKGHIDHAPVMCDFRDSAFSCVASRTVEGVVWSRLCPFCNIFGL